MWYLILFESLVLLAYSLFICFNRGPLSDINHLLGIAVVFFGSLVVNGLILKRTTYKFPWAFSAVCALITAILFGAVVPQVTIAVATYFETGYWRIWW